MPGYTLRDRLIRRLGGAALYDRVSPAEARAALAGGVALPDAAVGTITPWSARLHTDHQARMLRVLGLLFVVFVAWAALFSVDKVTRGGGRVLPSVQNQVVQHLEGGIVQAILVQEGQRVRRGQVLFRIASAALNAEYENARAEMLAKRITLARMDAEIAGAPGFAVPADLAAQAPEAAAREVTLFASRRAQRGQQTGIIDEQARARRADIAGLQARLVNLHAEERLMVEQLQKLEAAFREEAISEREVLDKRSSLAALRTRLADVANQIPQSAAQLSESAARRGEVLTHDMQDVKERAAALRLELAKAAQQFTAATDKQAREELRAPIDGIVNKLYVQTVGGVIKGGEPIAEIVPVDKTVLVEAHVAPRDRGNVWPGLPASIKITAYESTLYGGMEAHVIDVSPDVMQDPKGEPYYRVRLSADTTSFGPGKPVIPGMTAEVNIRAGHQTVLDYILGPLIRLRDNALRE